MARLLSGSALAVFMYRSGVPEKAFGGITVYLGIFHVYILCDVF